MITKTDSTWSDAEWQDFAAWLQTELKNNVLAVGFTKKDGEYRLMTCSLREKDLPPIVESARSKERKSANNLAVFDIGKREWRSFIVRNVLTVEKVEKVE